MRIHCYKKDEESDVEVVRLSTAKRLIKEYGGVAWTEHYDRNGGLFEVTPIKLENNRGVAYNVRYNRHL